MKKLLLTFIMYITTALVFSQDVDLYLGPKEKVLSTNEKTAACGSPFVSTGYPAWTNYWGGYQFNIVNTSGTTLQINSFEARFQGNAGYRIYTKTGTFVGFETNAAAWTLVGSIGGGLMGAGTTIPTAIPIAVNVCIPAGGTQAFYLTRSNNNVGNRHLYVPGTGTPGTTIYASDANLGITEAHYVTPYFAALYAQSRRPSLDVCYTLNCTILPIELAEFNVYNKDNTNHIYWVTTAEINNDYFTVERSTDALTWEIIDEVDGAGHSSTGILYEIKDNDYNNTTNYYRLSQTDYDGTIEYFNIISINNSQKQKEIESAYDLFYNKIKDLKTHKGLVIIKYTDGTVEKLFY